MSVDNIGELSLEQLDLEGVRTLLKWAGQEGWEPGPQDADVFYASDPQGFVGYFDKGEMIAGGSIVSYNGEFGFMGLFIVKPELRNAGIGRKLWYQRRHRLLSRLNKGAAIGMDGVVAMQPFYAKGGFKIAFRDVRYERVGEHFAIAVQASHILPEDFEEVMAYDKQCFGFARPQFMKAWLALSGSFTFKYKDENGFRGFAVMRKSVAGYKIGPLFADNAQVAEELYKSCLNAAENEKVALDIPAINQAALKMVEKFGAQSQFECARMYYGKPPLQPMEKIFGITTFELG